MEAAIRAPCRAPACNAGSGRIAAACLALPEALALCCSGRAVAACRVAPESHDEGRQHGAPRWIIPDRLGIVGDDIPSPTRSFLVYTNVYG